MGHVYPYNTERGDSSSAQRESARPRNDKEQKTMELEQKLAILSEAARYDASCASSGSDRQAPKSGGLGGTCKAGICHSWSDDGRCISLLKVLMSNACMFNCAYCANRCSSNIERATLTPHEIATLTTEFYRRNYIEGLFISSGVVKNADYTMELMAETVRLLRTEYKFYGYIHAKVIPGADPLLIQRIGLLADRISVNIELPSADSLKLLAPQKSKEKILTPMAQIRRMKEQNLAERRQFRSAPKFAPSGQSTQMIVGATGDSDAKILSLTSGLYKHYRLKRVYFSAYVPVGNHPALPPADIKTPLRREHRLYQADWLLRLYQFDVSEITEEGENLDEAVDPKCSWALRHLDFFPVEINTADEQTLLRVPGIGLVSSGRIIEARRSRSLEAEDLRKLGVVVKRAKYFITCKGKLCVKHAFAPEILHELLADERDDPNQMTLAETSRPQLCAAGA